MAKGPLWVMLTFRQKSRDLGSKGLFFFKHLPIYNWAPFLYWTEKALQTLFWGRVLCSSLRVPVGLCYAHLPFQRHLLLNHAGWGCSLFGILLLWTLGLFWVCLCDMAFISETISFKLTQKGVLYPLMGPSILNEGFLPKL